MDDQDQHWKQLTAPSNLNAQRGMSQAQKSLDRQHWISQRARLVFGSYRRDDFADPETFLNSLLALLEKYSDKVILEATEPAGGMQLTFKFPPSLAEVKEFCDETHRRQTAGGRWDAMVKKQLEERAAHEAECTSESAEHRAAVVRRVKAELAVKGFGKQMAKQSPDDEPLPF